MDISRSFVETMFAHYVERVRRNQKCAPSSQDGIWSAGEISEAGKWLKHLGVDLSYERIQPMVEGKTQVCAWDPGEGPEEPWYTEAWYDEDLQNALEENGLPDDETHMEALKAACGDIFDDKSDRNCMISETARSLFKTEIAEGD